MRVIDEIRNFKADEISAKGIEELREASRDARIWAVIATSVAKSGHPAGALSSIDIFMTLLGAANFTPENMDSPDRDRIIISHGHTSAGYYAALAEYGFFPAHEMAANFRRVGSGYPGHVERGVPGVDWSTGNLGQGLSAGVGFALAQRACGRKSHIWVVMGDGEQVKGQLAEARRVATKENITNITVLVDWNDIQISGHINDVMPVDIPALWGADGWSIIECDGHDYNAIYKAMKSAKESKLATVILCHTLMGKGVSFMEGVPDYHGKAASGDKIAQAIKELGGDVALYDKAVEERGGVLPRERQLSPDRAILDVGTPHTYTKDDKKDNRGAFGKALAEIGELNYKKPGRTPILAFDCDLAGSVKVDAFAKVCPENFFETGIQEHNTATIAGAASVAGAVTVWADFGVFACVEVFNQQRLNDINFTNTKTVLTHTGLDVGEDGCTHQCIDYVGLYRNAFNWRVVVPADPNQTDRATRWMMVEPGNICLAMGRSLLPVVLKEDGTPFYGGDYKFRYGAVETLRDGKDVAILAMGHVAKLAIEARDLLAKDGISAKVLHCAAPLGINAQELFDAVGNLPLLTVEDHHVNTGIGVSVDMLYARAGKAVKMKHVGVTRYGLSGRNVDVLADMGISAAGFADAAKDLLK